jgi:haloalkane dehalogenase
MVHTLAHALLALAAAPGPAEEVRPGVLRTPDERFAGLPGFDFAPHYVEIDGYRVHYLDEGPRDADPVFLLHGEPTWSYLYRKMIPVLVAAGHRCVVPDLVGFGRSDKPTSMDVHTYAFHVGVMTKLVEALDLDRATFFGQDWGGLIGLRVVAENPERFARVVVSNTGLPVGDVAISEAFLAWKAANQAMIDRGDMPVGALLARSAGDPSVAAAYDAPFPDPSYKAGPLVLPQRVPVTPDDPARAANLAAWAVLAQWEKPFLTAFGDSDPITGGGERIFQARVPGAKGLEHPTVKGAGHFIQESHGDELARIIADFIEKTR